MHKVQQKNFCLQPTPPVASLLKTKNSFEYVEIKYCFSRVCKYPRTPSLIDFKGLYT